MIVINHEKRNSFSIEQFSEGLNGNLAIPNFTSFVGNSMPVSDAVYHTFSISILSALLFPNIKNIEIYKGNLGLIIYLCKINN